MSENAKYIDCFEYRDNRLKLVETYSGKGYFSMIPNGFIKNYTRNVVGFRVISDSSKPIFFGIKCVFTD